MKKAFTLAEILITLTVIGVVAAISIPALMLNINDKVFETKRKALLSRMTQAVSQMSEFGNFGQYSKDSETGDITDTVAESFVVKGLSKVYKIKNICSANNFDKCGISESVITLQGSTTTIPDNIFAFNSYYNLNFGKNTQPAAFTTANGESLLVYYNPDCHPASDTDTTRTSNNICANFVYDLNGLDEPNEIGKDMGVMSIIFDVYNEPEVVAPNPYFQSPGSAPSYSSEKDKDAASLCKAKSSDLSLPNLNEAMSLTLNNRFTGFTAAITGTIVTPGPTGTVWTTVVGKPSIVSRTSAQNVVCVKN